MINKKDSVYGHWYCENVVWRQIDNTATAALIDRQIVFFQSLMRGVR